MGWNSWNAFLDEKWFAKWSVIDERAILDQADAFNDRGLRSAGYEYLVMDDGYQGYARDQQGRIQTHPRRFPSGVAGLAAAVHERGLKFGLYLVPGSLTCGQQYMDYHASNIGSLGFESVDAQSLAEWGVDLLKYDWCRAHINDGLDAPAAFAKMGAALKEYAPNLIYSISEYSLFKSHLWAPEFANMWRTTDDLFTTWPSILRTINQQVELYPYSGPGHWNDPDMLQVGNGGLSLVESKSHMAIWCILNAPLFAGNNLVTMSDEIAALLTNPRAIAVDQDWSGEQGRLIHQQGALQVWQKLLSAGGAATIYLNTGEIEISAELGQSRSYGQSRDVWSDDLVSDEQVKLAPHESLFLISK
jgi:alpha-galactosidase